MDTFKRAVYNSESASLLLHARSKQTLNALTLQVESDIRRQMGFENELKVIRVNSTLNNSENKIQAKFIEALGLQKVEKGQMTSIELNEKVREFF